MTANGVDLHTEELRDRIAWLIRLRWLAAAGVAFVVWAAPRAAEVHLAQGPLYALTAALAIYNLVLWGAARRLREVVTGRGVAWFATVQVSIDLVFLTALLHFAGGIENPFVCYYVFHIVIASILLARNIAYFQVALAIGLLTGLASLEASGVLPHHHLQGLFTDDLYDHPHYLAAVLFVTGTMLYFAAFMATSITARLRERESQIMDLSTSLRAHAEELEQAYQALRQLEEEKSEYMLRAAHHLRTPLAAAESMLAVVAEGRTGPVSEKSMEMVQRSRERLRNMLDLARDLLTLSRAREGTTAAKREPVDLARLLSTMEGDFSRQAAAASVSLDVSVDSGLRPISGVPESLAELLENLISNAIKYTRAGGKVTASLRKADDGVELQVSDTGIGIPVEEQASIFEDFYRASNARTATKDGTGLGLSIVKTIAAAHGAEVQLESEPGRGTTFRVRFPEAVREIV